MTDTSMDSLAAGSGLSGFGTSNAGPVTGVDVPPASAPLSLAPASASPQATPDSGGSFGSGFKMPSFGPNYTPPDPTASPLDQTSDMLQQRIKRANDIATNPLLQFFNPQGAAAARQFVPQATEQLQKIRQQQATMQANRQQAATLGLHPGDVPDEASQQDRVEVAKARALQGDLKVFQGLQAVDPKSAEAIQDQVHEVVAGHLTNAQHAFDSLSYMQNQGQYAAKLQQLRQDGTLKDLETLGMKVPDSYAEFNATKAREGKALRDARVGVDTIRQKLEERNTYQPMEEKEAKTYNGRMTTAYGDQITNGTWSRNASSNARGFVVNGAGDPRDLGKNFTFATPEQRTAIKEEFSQAVPKEDVEKYRAFNRTYTLATTDAKGNALPSGKLNTNPNVQQGVAEGLASMLRGGQGGANVGLLKIELAKRGWAQGQIDNLISNYNGTLNTLFANANRTDKPYLSQATQKQVRDVMDVLQSYNSKNIADRASQIAQRAGALGLDAAALGFGKGESAGAIDDALKAGRDAEIARITPQHQAIGGGDGVFQLGAQRPGAAATSLQPGTTPTTQLPGASPLRSPVQQAQPVPPGGGGGSAPPSGPTAPTPAASQPSGAPGGGGPGGASDAYTGNVRRIESGSPQGNYTATTPGSSASGAYQMIDSTWMANRPPGATALRAKDATPAQQDQAYQTFTAKNAAALHGSGLPVTDTTLYVAHNLGAGGAQALLSASPTEDARSIVGEKAAQNNPLFFKGRPTVATVLQRYQTAMAGGGQGNGATQTANAAPQGEGFMARMFREAQAGAPPPSGLEGMTSEEIQQANDRATQALPAIASTAGAVGGGMLAGPPGAIVGGGAGGAVGNRVRNYLQGNPQSVVQDAKEGALGAVLGIAPEGRPLVGALARVGGSAAVQGGATLAEGGSTEDATDAAVKGGGYALGGEVLGRFIAALGPTAHRVLSNYLPGAQAELSAQAGKLAEARQVLQTEQPKLAGANGASSPNPKYDAAKKTEEDATAYIKAHNQNPDDMVYAYEQAKAGTSSGEALTMRKANSERSAVGQGYDELRQQVKDTGVGAPKPNQPVPDGPLSMLRTAQNPTGKVEAKFQPEAEHAEMLIKAPAKDWGEKWQQLQNAGTELIKKRMDFLQAGDKTSAAAMDGLFQGVRNQQKAAAAYVFGKENGAKVISHLEDLDTRYAKIMSATQGMNFEKMRTTLAGGNTPEARQLEANFKAFAKDDPSAIRAFNAMKAGARGDWKSEAALMGPVIMGEVAANMHGVPTMGAISSLVGGHRIYKLVQGYMNAKLLGKAVMFKDFLKTELPEINNLTGNAGQRAAVMQQ